MSNFGDPIENQTEKDILNAVNRFSLEGAQVAMGELTRRRLAEVKESIEKLNVSIKRLNSNSEFYSKVLVLLTVIIILLTIVLAIPVIREVIK